jgi:DNA-binding transcriptional ArsR family regulator
MPRRRRSRPFLSEEATRLVADRFRALADPSRLRILSVLMEGERSVGDLVEALALEQPTVSRHLAVLRRQGIVARRTDGNRAFYCIADPTVVKLCEVVCGGLAERLATGLEELPSPESWRGAGI